MESNVINILLGLIAILSFVWSYFSEQNRIIAIIVGFILLIMIAISEQNTKISNIEREKKELKKNLKYMNNL